MNGKVHAFIGTGTLAVICTAYPEGFDLFGVNVMPYVGLATVAFGSLLPDIDMQRTSMGSRHKVVSKIVNKAGGGHRGITHTLLFCALLTFLQYMLASVYMDFEIVFRVIFALVMGFTVKAFLDVVSKHMKKIPIFVPLGLSVIILLLTFFGSNTEYMLSLIFSSLFGITYGYILHIWADIFNGKGVPLLWPISSSKISVMDLPSEGAVPWIFAVLNILAITLVFHGGQLWNLLMQLITHFRG